ncbi:MAG: hypothetical protein J7498_08095 [Sphingobium sp.]|nr:hypothetical protein [Sphingobium sp.]
MSKLPNDRPGLDDPRNAAYAWTRFRRILLAMAATAMACALLVVAYLWGRDGPLPLVFIGLTIAGVWATIMMAALLMGLMFLSSGTGHDDQVEDRVGKDVLGEDEERE